MMIPLWVYDVASWVSATVLVVLLVIVARKQFTHSVCPYCGSLDINEAEGSGIVFCGSCINRIM